MKEFGNKSLVVAAVAVVIMLMLSVLIITYRNNKIIEENRLLQKQAEDVKVTVSQFAIVLIHNLDLGLRGYALFGDEKYLHPLWFALRDKDSLFHTAEKSLISQNYPLAEFQLLKDSIEAYADYCLMLKDLYDRGQMDEFYVLGDKDKGYHLWLQYEKLAAGLFAYEDQINEQAQKRYHTALRNNYLAQLLLFLICVPTLLFTANHTRKKFLLAEKLRVSEAERAALLARQNETLERLVAERTREIKEQNDELYLKSEEIEAQNEELLQQQEQIASQMDMLAKQNDQLNDAQVTIRKQNEEIKQKNDILEEEVKKRTGEVLAYSQQLEQFAFMAAHKLRAPVARVLGLGNVFMLGSANSQNEKDEIIERLVATTRELDEVITDLNAILEIRQSPGDPLTVVNLEDELTLVRSGLESEISRNHAEIIASFECTDAAGVKTYIDSIFYNLISNALKYRHPKRNPVIRITSYPAGEYICVSIADNGLGIEQAHIKDLFSFYVRFHFHVDGKGLGLYLVKTQVTAMGGTIDVESEAGVGTVFKIYLKRKV